MFALVPGPDSCIILQNMSEILRQLGLTVREARRGRGWSRRELAEQAGVSERFLADIETGSGNPSVLKLSELARALGTTTAALLERPVAAEPRCLALLGLRGAGKSSVGKLLAERLGWDFIELDALVEQAAGLSLNDVFQMHGEAYYRRIEYDVLREVLARDEPLVLATGGGVVTSPRSFALLRQHARTVWLHAEPEDHWARVVAQGDTRPMADNEQAFAELCSILQEREPLYRRAHEVVETSGRTVAEISAELVEAAGGNDRTPSSARA